MYQSCIQSNGSTPFPGSPLRFITSELKLLHLYVRPNPGELLHGCLDFLLYRTSNCIISVHIRRSASFVPPSDEINPSSMLLITSNKLLLRLLAPRQVDRSWIFRRVDSITPRLSTLPSPNAFVNGASLETGHCDG